MSGSSRILIWARALASALVIAVLAAGVPWLLVATVGSPYPDSGIDWARPLTDATLLGLLAALAWVFWAQMVVCLVVEAVAEVRTARGASGDWLTRVPGTLGGQQQLARALVNSVVAVGLSTAGGAHVAAPVAASDAAWTLAAAPASEPSQVASTVPAGRSSKEEDHRTHLVTVAKGDSLWSLAEHHLGSGELWKRIAELNRGRLMADGSRFTQASMIRPGWRLLVPEPRGRPAQQITVEAGDTLWQLADEEYGEGDRWRRLYAANRARIGDPDVIYPGQVLEVPRPPHRPGEGEPGAADTRPRSAPENPDPRERPHHGGPTPGEAPAEPTPAEAPQPSAAPNPPPATSSLTPAARDEADGQSRPLAALLTGGGSLLAASALAVLMLRRRAQMRRRRAGRTIARTPDELVSAERIVREAGASATDRASFLDLALRNLSRQLSDRGGRLPDVAAVRIDDERLDLLLNEPHPDSPPPWVGSDDGRLWSISGEAAMDPCDAIAPYPTLVSIGVDDEGATWLLDLESAGVVGLEGDTGLSIGLARFVAAELAVNRWSDDVGTVVSGFGEELVGMHPERIGHASAPPFEDLAKKAQRVAEATRVMGYDVLAGRMDGRGADTFMPSVIVTVLDKDNDSPQPPGLSEIPRRHAVALVLAGSDVGDPWVRITIEQGGVGTVHPWGVRLRVNSLTAEEAAGIAGLLRHADVAEDEAMPAVEGDSHLRGLIDEAGAIRPELVAQRTPDSVQHTVLPRPNEEYLSRAATTVDELEALAPAVPKQTREQVLELDPDLEHDLADWKDPTCPRPKVRVLGPIEVTASGERTTDIERRLAYYTELVAFLAMRDHGATPEQMGAAFNVQTNSMHSRIGSVRKWLGSDAETGEWYLPESTLSPSAKSRGIPTYELVGALCDADLFRRLRARAQARGPAGMDDMVAALRLVRGAAFEQPRRGGYGWLAEAPQDHYLTAAIVDVAHTVATEALHRGDLERARWAAETALTAAPSDDRPRLDLAAVIEVEAGADAARAFLRASVADDEELPFDPLGARGDAQERRSWG